MKTLAKLAIVVAAAVSAQTMAASKDPFAAMEPAGPSQHGNMSGDKMKSFSWGGKDESEKDAVEASVPGAGIKAAETKAVESEVVESKTTESKVETTEPQQEADVVGTPEEASATQTVAVPKAESKPEGQAEQTAAKAEKKESSLEEEVIEFASKAEKFFDKVTFSKGVNESLFQDGDTLK